MFALLGDQAAPVLGALRQPDFVSLRVNTLRLTAEEGWQELGRLGIALEAVPWLAEGAVISREDKATVSHSELAAEGKVYFQDLASMVPPLMLEVNADTSVLDLCAAPGSKTSQIAALMDNRGEIAAVELSRKRFFRLLEILDTLGVENVRTFCRDGSTVWRHRPDHFDRILLDAPCSSEGRFRVDQPKTYSYWSASKIKECVRRQKSLFASAVRSLKPGGLMIYSTCTFGPEENEGILDWALSKFASQLSIEPLDLGLPNVADPVQSWQGIDYKNSLHGAKRILPSKAMHGFFLARLRKQL